MLEGWGLQHMASWAPSSAAQPAREARGPCLHHSVGRGVPSTTAPRVCWVPSRLCVKLAPVGAEAEGRPEGREQYCGV